jgi:hypothetical protein
VVELKGALTGDGLLGIVQLIGELHHSGTLHLTRGGAAGSLAFDAGRLVGATCGDDRGLQAVARCAMDLQGGEFIFAEGAPTLEHTLDLSPADLTRLLTRIDSGDFSLASATHEQQQRDESTCPALGFADDREHHYSRSTAMHRCYASGAASVVSAQEQRELCLSGRFAACPRFRNNGATALPTTPPAEMPRPAPVPIRATSAPAAPPRIPPGVAARLAAASQMHLSGEEPLEPELQPTPGAHQAPVSAKPGLPEEPPDRRRRLMLIGGGAGLGLLLIALLTLLALPALRGGLALRSSTPVAARSEPAASPALSSPPDARPVNISPADAPSPRPAAPTPPRAAAPAQTAAPRPTLTAPPEDTNALMDVRFAGGRPDRWLDNPPYAAWRDGAYRLLARDSTHFVAVGIPINQVLGDVVVSATFRKTGGPPGGGYGLIVRDQGPEPRDGVNQELNAYVLETGDLGEYGVWRRDGDHWVDLVPWTRSAAVRSGGSPNDLLVRAVGDQLTFSVNGSVIAVVTDDTFSDGGVGLFVGGDYNDVALDRFNVQLPE